MKIKTAELSGKALDWAVWACESPNDPLLRERRKCRPYATHWSQSGPIIQREGIDVLRDGTGWTALKTATIAHPHLRLSGSTPMVAAMRCFVASKLGQEIDVPDELLTASEVASESSSLESERNPQRPRGG